jgi:hypothetical protein
MKERITTESFEERKLHLWRRVEDSEIDENIDNMDLEKDETSNDEDGRRPT